MLGQVYIKVNIGLNNLDAELVILFSLSSVLFSQLERTILLQDNIFLEGAMTRLMVDAVSELCSPLLKGSNSVFIATIASDLFPQTEYLSLE